MKRTGIYKKWSQTSRRRIQHVGETEDPGAGYSQSRQRRRDDVEVDGPLPELSTLTKDKGVLEDRLTASEIKLRSDGIGLL